MIIIATLIIACGNSNPTLSQEQLQEIDKQSQFAGTDKPKDSSFFDFEKFAVNQVPDGWSQYFTGAGSTDWKITTDAGNKVLAQLYSENPGNHFNIIVNDNIIAKDMILTVRAKGVAGKKDQGGGFVWRFIDKENYYIVRANPLEDNVVLYKVQNGSRNSLPLIGKGETYGVDVETIANKWHTLKLIVKGDLCTVFLDGKELFKVQDTTFPDAGKIGLWTKADAVTYFDDFEIKQY